MPTASRGKSAAPRDVRLDFFRGMGMFIIFIAHVPANPWAGWIPARFGYSDATEIFVFCSGMASALAFASVFEKSSYLLGCARIAHRCWQVYWAHIGLFFAATAMMCLADSVLDSGGMANINSVNLGRFVSGETAAGLVGLFTLTYVPNLFDILPMYLVILGLIPVVMLLARLGPAVPVIFCAGLWCIATLGFYQLPAEPWSDRTWYFHPFAWQLVFFTGFAFVQGWLPVPPINRSLLLLSGFVVTAAIVQSLPLLSAALPDVLKSSAIPVLLTDKTLFGLLRYVHFLALAYLAFAVVGPRGERLSGILVNVCCRVGQQALAVFIAGIMLALVGGIFLRYAGYSGVTVAATNLAGLAGLIAVAYVVAWFKSDPWKTRPQNVPTATSTHTASAGLATSGITQQQASRVA